MINRLLSNWKKYIDNIDEKKLFWAMNIGIVAFYILYFWVICQSSYSADDLFNANARAVDYSADDSVWQLTIRQMKIWMEAGRFFPFSNYAYLLFAYVTPTRFSYKLFLMILVIINNVLFAKCIEKITKSKEIRFLSMILFPMSIQLTCDFDSALYCFHGLMQFVMMWSTISLLLVFSYLDRVNNGAKKITDFGYLIASALCLCLAVGTYEVGYVMAAFIGLGVWAYTGKVVKTLKVLIPNIFVYILMLYGNYWFRANAAEIAYDGIAVNFDLKKIGLAFLKQCYSTIPFANYAAARMHNAGYSVRTLISGLEVRDLIMLALYMVIITTVIILLEKKVKEIKKLKFVFYMGCSLFIFPGLLIAMVSKYQNLSWGEGHLSSYIQSFGLLLILLTMAVRVLEKCRPNVKRNIAICMVCISAGVLIGQQMEARASVEYRYQIYGYPRDNVTAACRMGLLDDVSEENMVFAGTGYIFDQIDTSGLYTMGAQRHLQVISNNQIVPILVGKYGQRMCYQFENEKEKFFAVTSYADADHGYAIAGRCLEIVLDYKKENVVSMIIESPMVYIDNVKNIDTSKWELLSQSGNKSLYRMTGAKIDVLNYNIE